MFKQLFNTSSRRPLLAALALAGLYGCAKQELAQAPSATLAKTTIPGGLTEQSVGDTTGAAAWKKFVSSVESGYQKDPAGQYVSKDTWVEDTGTGPRPTRPKGLQATQLRTQAAGNPTGFVQPFDPDGGGGGGAPTPPPPPVTSGFYSSSGLAMGLNPVDNPNNYILNLTIIKGSSADIPARAGFTKIPVDLNKGAGGRYIYLCFTRQNGDIAETPGYHPEGGLRFFNTQEAIAKMPITAFEALPTGFLGTVITANTPVRFTGYDWIQNYDGIWPLYWHTPDLNDGAGGKYIYPLYTKGLASGGSLSINSLSQTPIKEVGVLFSYDDSVQPPAGWTKLYQDLNDGAGGYFIYFCYKK